MNPLWILAGLALLGKKKNNPGPPPPPGGSTNNPVGDNPIDRL